MPAGIVPTLTSENWRKRARTLHIFGAEIPSVFRRFRWTKKTLRASWFFALHSKQKIDFTWPKDVGVRTQNVHYTLIHPFYILCPRGEVAVSNGTKYWRMLSAWTDHIPSNFLKAVFHKFYLVHSWILCFKWFYINI